MAADTIPATCGGSHTLKIKAIIQGMLFNKSAISVNFSIVRTVIIMGMS
jgi:hypothetical protein